MKKLIMLVLLASSLFAVDCSYWLKKTYEDITLLHLVVADEEYSEVNSIYRRFLESSRNTIAICDSEEITSTMFTLRKDALELLNKK